MNNTMTTSLTDFLEEAESVLASVRTCNSQALAHIRAEARRMRKQAAMKALPFNLRRRLDAAILRLA